MKLSEYFMTVLQADTKEAHKKMIFMLLKQKLVQLMLVITE